MAPEMHRREPGRAQSDLFSTGLVALEMLKGHQMADLSDYNENSLLDFKMTLAQRLEEFLPPEVLKNLELVSVFRKFLAPDTATRFANADEAESGEHKLVPPCLHQKFRGEPGDSSVACPHSGLIVGRIHTPIVGRRH